MLPGRLRSWPLECHAALAQMQRHSELGRDIIAGAGMSQVAEWVHRFHERWDGHGYAQHLSGTDTPLESRILAVADALEAMTSPRVYRTALPLEQALTELELGAGTQFDPQLAARLARLVRLGELEIGDDSPPSTHSEHAATLA